MRRSPRPARPTRGFSLVEVLVAILVLALGLLGLAALQARGVKFNHDAYARSQASYLANELMDLVRANVANAAEYASVAPAGSCDPALSTVANDLRCWLDAVQTLLPQGSATVVQTGDQFDVTLRWQERGAREASSETECTSVPSRAWVNSACLVTQNWTFML